MCYNISMSSLFNGEQSFQFPKTPDRIITDYKSSMMAACLIYDADIRETAQIEAVRKRDAEFENLGFGELAVLMAYYGQEEADLADL